MLYTEKTKKAMKIMCEAHRDQTDKSGLPYILHPWHVAEQMDDEDSICVALLHDTIEDTDVTLDYLKEQGFSENIINVIDLLTHRQETPYFDYVRQISHNPLARKVKIADLRHNAQPGRLDQITEKDQERLDKYKKALAILGEE